MWAMMRMGERHDVDVEDKTYFCSPSLGQSFYSFLKKEKKKTENDYDREEQKYNVLRQSSIRPPRYFYNKREVRNILGSGGCPRTLISSSVGAHGSSSRPFIN